MIETLTLKDDYHFLVSDGAGQVLSGLQGYGLYFEDTRYLSHLELNLNGQVPQSLSHDEDYNIAATFHLSSPYFSQLESSESAVSPAQTAVAHAVGVTRRRLVQNGLIEQIEFVNYHTLPLTLEFSLTLSADFADIFEVRGFPRQQNIERLATVEVSGDGRQFEFHSVPARPGLKVRRLLVETSLAPESMGQVEAPSPLNGITLPEISLFYRLELPTNRPFTLSLKVVPEPAQKPVVEWPANKKDFAAQVARLRQVFEQWQATCSRVQTGDHQFNQIVQTSTLDLRSLMQQEGDWLVITAGLPWYFSLFGRDSLIAAMQSLSLNPQIAVDTLRALAAHQGTKYDDWRDEEPGKILHELRRGDMILNNEMPHGPYYGSIDSTPLFIWCFAETLKWLDDPALFAELWPAVERGLAWASKYGDPDGDGYLEFTRRSERGILHQGWKDSDESMGGSLGPRPEPPLALVEVQGYYYAALTGLAATLRRYGDSEQKGLAERLDRQAAELKAKFNRDFWWPEAKFLAQALDGRKQQVRNFTSNPGHCLWSGIVDADKAGYIVERLMQPDLLSGWGIRTMSTLDPTYNPMSYHNGSVWPHDNSLIVAGFRRYGYDDTALTLIGQLLDAAATFPAGRLPELFCGFPRQEDGIIERAPAAYPVSCSPQAWAAGSAPLLVQTLLGLEAEAAEGLLRVNPALPPRLDQLDLQGLRLGRYKVDLSFRRDPGTGRVEVVNAAQAPVQVLAQRPTA